MRISVRSETHARNEPQSLRLIDERPLLSLGQQLPFGAQSLRDLRIMHLRIVLGHFAALSTRPHHERIHGPFDVLGGELKRMMDSRRHNGARSFANDTPRFTIHVKTHAKKQHALKSPVGLYVCITREYKRRLNTNSSLPTIHYE